MKQRTLQELQHTADILRLEATLRRMELTRLRRVYRIAQTTEAHFDSLPVEMRIDINQTLLHADKDNFDSFNEALDPSLSVASPELHTRACTASGIEYCVCGIDTSKNELQEVIR